MSGTLTDTSDVYRAVLDVQPNQIFSIYGSDTAVPPNSLWVNAYTAGSWAIENLGGRSSSGSGPRCEIGPARQATQALLIVAPYYESQDPISFGMQGVCVTGCSARPARCSRYNGSNGDLQVAADLEGYYSN